MPAPLRRILLCLLLSLAYATAGAQAVPQITLQPSARTVVTGGSTVTLAASVTGSTSLQWKRNGLTIPGATEASLSLAEARAGRDDGWYQLVATNAAGASVSRIAFVSVGLQRGQFVGWGNNYGYPSGAGDALSVAAGENSSGAVLRAGGVQAWGWWGGPSLPADGPGGVQISSKYRHTLALLADGIVVAWGDGSAGKTTVPAGLTDVVGVAAGYQHSVAVKADGSVVAWGSDTYGATLLPAGLSNIVMVSAGDHFSLALKADGTVVAWGRNDSGQSTVPAGLANVVAVAAGWYHSLALKADGTVVAWGNGDAGRIAVPTGLTAVQAIAAGQSHSLALKTDGSVVAWGNNNYGKAQPPAGLNHVRSIAAGFEHSLVLRESMGDTAPVITTQPAAQVAFAGQTVTLEVGVNVGTGYDTTYQWRKGGVNLAGATAASLVLPRVAPADAGSYEVQISNWLDTVTSSAATVTIDARDAVGLNITGRKLLSPGESLTLEASTVLSGPLTYEWRRNGFAIPGATGSSYTLAAATAATAGVYQVVVTNAGGGIASPAAFVWVNLPAQVRAWGSGSLGQTAVPPGLGNVLSVAAGSGHTLALKADGSVVGWGDNRNGQLNIPTALADVVAVAASGNYSMALRGNGQVAVWGGSINYVPADLRDVVAIAAGDHAMALRRDGSMVVWGGDAVRTDTPSDLGSVAAVAAGSGGARVALRSDGLVVPWGRQAGFLTLPVGGGEERFGSGGVFERTFTAAGGVHELQLLIHRYDTWDGENLKITANGRAIFDRGLSQSMAPTFASGGDAELAWETVISPTMNLGGIYWWQEDDNALLIRIRPRSPLAALSLRVSSALDEPMDNESWSVRGTWVNPEASQAGFKAVALGAAHSLGLLRGGTVLAAGNNDSGQANVPVGLARVTALAAGSNFSLALKEDGGVAAWGHNSEGQVSGAEGLTKVFALAAGANHAVAVRDTSGDVAPVITTPPVAVSALKGTTATFTVVATGTVPLAYQWRKGGVAISGATNAVLTLNGVQPADAGEYSVVVSNGVGSVMSAGVALTVPETPTFTVQPAARTVVSPGAAATLSATATGATAYQWRRNGIAIPGATNASLSLTNVQAGRDDGWYQVVASNATGPTLSNTAFVNVSLPVRVVGWGRNDNGQTTIPGGLSSVISIAGGFYHGMALNSDGAVVAWGNNGNGQATIPSGLTGVVAIAAGSYHSLALKSDGTVVAWGNNGNGQATIPSGLSGVVAIAAGSYFSMALKADGTVVAWGYNDYGQTTIPGGLNGVVAIAAGAIHGLALKADGTVVAWGNSGNGQTTIPSGLNGVVAIAAGNSHSLALKADGMVVGWGNNGNGQTTVPSGVGLVASIAAGNSHSLALKADGTVVAWGTNWYGETSVPSELNSVVAVAGGEAFSLAAYPNAGDLAPTIIAQPQGVAANRGAVVTLAVTVNVGTSSGTTYQWRKGGVVVSGATNASYQINGLTEAEAGSYDVMVTNYLGTATSAAATVTMNTAPVVNATSSGRYLLGAGQTLTLQLDPGLGASGIQWRRSGLEVAGATGAEFTASQPGYYQARYTAGGQTIVSAPIFVLPSLQRGQLAGWGSNSNGELTFTSLSGDVTEVRAGERFSLTVARSGLVTAWGRGTNGRTTVPAGLGSVVQTATSYMHTLALKSDGTVVAWGDTASGKTTVPAGLANVVGVAAGYQHSVVVRVDGSVVVWGSETYGATVLPAGLSNVVMVSAGDQFTLALKADGTVVAWGRNDFGQSTVPAGLANVVAVAAGGYHSLALKADGTVVAWGNGDAGRIAVPTGLTAVQAIAAGQSHSLALKTDGSVVAWGSNDNNKSSVPAGLNRVQAIAAGWNHSLVLRESIGDTAPVITTQPAAQVAFAGQTVTLGVGVNVGTGYDTMYQWRKEGVNVAGATAASLVLPRVTPGESGTYDVVVSNWQGTATSAAAALTVNATAAVAMNVTGLQTVAPGGALTLEATSALPGTVTWQWRRNGQPIAGATNASLALALADATIRTAGVYQVVATNASGPVFGPGVFVNVTVPTQVRAWGLNTSGQTTIPAGLGNVLAVAAGTAHTLALKTDGTVAAWGDNTNGQLNLPAGLSGVAGIAAAGNYNLALKTDGTVVTWGGSINFTPAGVSNIVAVAAGANAMALRADGTVQVWDGSGLRSDTPAGLEGVIAISAGTGGHQLALKGDGSVVAWGNNYEGETAVPAGLGSVAAIAAGSGNSLVLLTDGTVRAWGRSWNGVTNVPAGLAGVSALAAGENTGYALKSDGSILAWGSNNHGRTSIPSDLTKVFAVAAGANHAVAVRDASGDVAPVITTPPVGLTLAFGASGSLSVVASGTAPLAYQWRKDGVDLPGAAGSNYALNSAQAAFAGAYDVLVYNGVGSVRSDTVVVAVAGPVAPTISTQPRGALLNPGNVASFSVSASGTAPLAYQWRKDGVTIAGATRSTYIPGPVLPTAAGSYDVVVSNAGGSVTSQPAVLLINPVAVITRQPESVEAFVGSPAVFSVEATSSSGMSYQWRKDGASLAGVTGTTLAISSPSAASAGVYDVVVSTAWGSVTSNPATLSVSDSQPIILSQPTGATLAVGGALTLSVVAKGSGPISYQWRRNGLDLPGATAASLVFTNAQTYNTGEYTVVVSNSLGSVTSVGATLTVVPRVVSYSSRLLIGPDGAAAVFTVEGSVAKRLLLRAVGPSLLAFGIDGLLADPRMEVFDAAGTLIASNDDWERSENPQAILSTGAAVGAFSLFTGSRDSAILRTFTPGSYSVRVTSAGAAWGIAYLEMHDADLATGPISTLPYVAIRGRLAPGAGVLIGGLGSNGRGQQNFLVRAVGPGLGLTESVADPAFLAVRSGTLVGQNDQWDAVPAEAEQVRAATSRLGLFPLAPGSRDAALVLSGNLHAGGHSIQVSTPQTSGGVALVELHDLGAQRPTLLPPVVASAPVAQRVAVGTPLTLKVLASGSPPLAYQWKKDGFPLPGRTQASYEVPMASAADVGQYVVAVTNASGTAVSMPAWVSVDAATPEASARQSVMGTGYAAGSIAVVSNVLTYAGSPQAVGWQVTLPPGWSFASDSVVGADAKPTVGTTGTLEWAWSSTPISPMQFSFTVNVPAGETGDKRLVAFVLLRESGALSTVQVSPDPLWINPAVRYHSGDTNVDSRLSLLELTRIIELYNTRHGAARSGCYTVSSTSTEDGFAPEPARAAAALVTLTRYHSADSNRDGRLSLLELTRVVELYNYRGGSSRTGQYRVQPDSEDGFAPGP